jgi:hypothetical protein
MASHGEQGNLVFVWARGAGGGGVVVMLLVVGGGNAGS